MAAPPAPAGAPAARGRGRRWALVAGAVALVLLVAALVAWRVLGGPHLQRLAEAPEATLAAGSSRVAIAVEVEGVPLLGPFTLAVAEGELDLKDQRARLERALPGVSAVPLLDRLLPEPVELVHDGAAAYLRLPIEGEHAWVRLAGTDSTEGPGATGPGLSNPAAALGLLRALEGLPEEAGHETVRGQPSTRYRVVVDLDEASDVLSGRAADAAEALRRLRGRSELPLGVWLDDDGRVTRLRYAVEPELPSVPRVTLTTDVELFDFGLPVDIRPPDPADVVEVDFTDLPVLDPLAWLRELRTR